MEKIIDFSVFYGHWPNYPVRGDLADIVAAAESNIMLISPLNAVWNRNQQQYNAKLLEDVECFENVYAVPVLDFSLPTWREEAQKYVGNSKVMAFRAFPNYGGDAYGEVFEFFNGLTIPLIIQKRMEDPRYQHPQAVVGDVDVAEILERIGPYRDLRLVLGGVKGNELDPVRILGNEHIYFETSQMDGFQVCRNAIDSGLLGRLLYGSFTPMFESSSGLRRLLPEISDNEADMILYKNSQKLLEE